jgi:hypothetical protein
LFGHIASHTALSPDPEQLDAGSTTTVYAVDGDDAAAKRVAVLLGAPVRTLPESVEAPTDHDVVIAVGRDASGTDQLPGFGAGPTERLETQGPDTGR